MSFEFGPAYDKDGQPIFRTQQYAVATELLPTPLDASKPMQVIAGEPRTRVVTRATHFSPQSVTEAEFLGVDFAGQIPEGVTIVSATVRIQVLRGKDPFAADMIKGEPVIDGTIVSSLIGGGKAGVYCAPKWTALLSNGEQKTLPEDGKGTLRITP